MSGAGYSSSSPDSSSSEWAFPPGRSSGANFPVWSSTVVSSILRQIAQVPLSSPCGHRWTFFLDLCAVTALPNRVTAFICAFRPLGVYYTQLIGCRNPCFSTIPRPALGRSPTQAATRSFCRARWGRAYAWYSGPEAPVWSYRPRSTSRTACPSTTYCPCWFVQVVRSVKIRFSAWYATTSALAVMVSPIRTGLTNCSVWLR